MLWRRRRGLAWRRRDEEEADSASIYCCKTIRYNILRCGVSDFSARVTIELPFGVEEPASSSPGSPSKECLSTM